MIDNRQLRAENEQEVADQDLAIWVQPPCHCSWGMSPGKLWLFPVWFLEGFERSQLQCVGCLHEKAKWAIWLGCNQKIILTAFAIFEFYFDCNIAHLLLTRLIARLIAVLHRHLWKCVQLQLEARQQSVKINCKFKVHVCCDVNSQSHLLVCFLFAIETQAGHWHHSHVLQPSGKLRLQVFSHFLWNSQYSNSKVFAQLIPRHW